MSEEEISEQEVALVLRRAAELDLTHDAPGPGLDVAMVEESAVEAGLSRQAVQTALAELRMGALQPIGSAPRPRRLLGRATVTARRRVPGPAEEVRAHLRVFLVRELFRVRRERGEQASWTRRDDLGAGVRRTVDKTVSKRLQLTDVRRVDVGVTAEPGADGRRVLVVLQADVSSICRDRGAFVATGGALGVAITFGSLLLGVLVDPVALLTAPVGAGAAAAGYGVGVTWYRKRVEGIQTALEAVLDDLERRPAEGGA
ncbi:MAG TPA: hypothetical protein VM942_07400 [Acidimicrobiales bacterium]|nr:hypothetical protein [Acidimicrobiales bacterium]